LPLPAITQHEHIQKIEEKEKKDKEQRKVNLLEAKTIFDLFPRKKRGTKRIERRKKMR
jgi:hypothetical protein